MKNVKKFSLGLLFLVTAPLTHKIYSGALDYAGAGITATNGYNHDDLLAQEYSNSSAQLTNRAKPPFDGGPKMPFDPVSPDMPIAVRAPQTPEQKVWAQYWQTRHQIDQQEAAIQTQYIEEKYPLIKQLNAARTDSGYKQLPKFQALERQAKAAWKKLNTVLKSVNPTYTNPYGDGGPTPEFDTTQSGYQSEEGGSDEDGDSDELLK